MIRSRERTRGSARPGPASAPQMSLVRSPACLPTCSCAHSQFAKVAPSPTTSARRRVGEKASNSAEILNKLKELILKEGSEPRLSSTLWG